MSPARAFLFLTLIGTTWGLSIPLTRIAVTAGHSPWGLIAWQLIIATICTALMLKGTGRALPRLGHGWPIMVFVAVIGTLLPNSFSYRAAAELPAGIMAIVIAIVPIFAVPVAWALGLERPGPKRLLGIAMGAVAITLIALPETSLPDPSKAGWILIALIAPLSYAIEGNGLAKFGTRGLDPIAVLFGASLLGTVVIVPVTLATGTWIDPVRVWGPAEWAILGIGLTHMAAYSGYIWLVGQAGSVFAAQVAYIVTGSGVIWSMLLLDERYAAWVWVALALMMAGIALVQPRRTEQTTQALE